MPAAVIAFSKYNTESALTKIVFTQFSLIASTTAASSISREYNDLIESKKLPLKQFLVHTLIFPLNVRGHIFKPNSSERSKITSG